MFGYRNDSSENLKNPISFIGDSKIVAFISSIYLTISISWLQDYL
jgi:hypothetical protein